MKKLGAVAGIVPNSSRRKLPSISTSATSSVSPRPSESTTAGVSAPGPMDVADREPEHGRADPRRAPRQRHEAHGDEPEEQEGAGRGADEDGGDPRLVGEADGEAGEHREGQSDGGEVDERRPLVARRDLVAEERGGADFARPAEGIEGEGERGEEAVDRRERQLAGIDAGDGDRHDGGEQRAGSERDKRADDEARSRCRERR